MRPFDAMFGSYQTFPQAMGNLGQYLEQAYCLLDDDSFWQDWLAERSAFFLSQPTLNALSAEQIESLNLSINSILPQNKLPQTPSNTPVKMLEYDGAISDYRRKMINEPRDARFQLPLNEAAALMNLSSTTVMALAELKQLQAKRPSQRTRIFHFDLRDIAAFVFKITASAQPVESSKNLSSLVRVDELGEKVAMFDIENKSGTSTIIRALLNESLNRHTESDDKSNDINKLWVDREAVLAILEQGFIDSLDRCHPKTKIRVVCNFHESQYIAFREVFHEKLVLAKSQHRYIAPATLKNFFRQYILLNRWCKLRDIDLKKVMAQLTLQNATFAFEPLQEHGIFILPKESYPLLQQIAL